MRERLYTLLRSYPPLAILHGTVALRSALQQLEQLNTVHDPPVAAKGIPKPSYLVLQSEAFHGWDTAEMGRISSQMNLFFKGIDHQKSHFTHFLLPSAVTVKRH